MPHPVQRLGAFLTELSRRKVYQGTALYIVLAVGTLEVVDIVSGVTPLPSWSVRVVFVVAVIGLPVAIALSWTYDVTSRGVVATGAAADDDRSPAPDRTTVAVLPFENPGGVPEVQPFVVGLHDDVLTELSRASALTVISRSSVQGFSSGPGVLEEVRRKLRVGTIVEGRLQMLGERGRLNIRTVDTMTERQVWAEALSSGTPIELP